MNSNNVDLTNCDMELIHIPGHIQSHGFLIAVNAESLLLTYVSENSIDFISASAESFLGLSLTQFEVLSGLSGKGVELHQLLKLGETQSNFEIINPYTVLLNNKYFDLIISVSGANYLLEFECVNHISDIQNQIGKSVSKILHGKTLQSLLYNTAKEVKEIVQYDRVMIYKFL